MARDQLVAADPSDLNVILTVCLVSSSSPTFLSFFFQLWHLRLSCLARLRLFNQTSAECTNLFSVLTSIEPPETRAYVFDRVLPFELEVMHTRLKYWAGDQMGYLDALAALLRKCKMKCRAAAKPSATTDESVVPMWRERGARVALIMGSQMVEMKVRNPLKSLDFFMRNKPFLSYRNCQGQSGYLNHWHLNLKRVQHSSLPSPVFTSKLGTPLPQRKFSPKSKQTKQ